jgi:2'-5' RNA ligase
MARIRTFIAIDPGDAIRNALIAVQHNLARETTDVKWVEEDNLHLTLLFLGEVDDRDLLGICRAVQGAAGMQSPFTMQITGIGCFPNPRRPRIVWAGVAAGSSELVTLHDALEPPLLELGCYRREDRPYSPHLTLGRTRSDKPGEQLAQALPKFQKWRGGETMVREVHVMSSELTPKGPLYTVLSRAKVGVRAG